MGREPRVISPTTHECKAVRNDNFPSIRGFG